MSVGVERFKALPSPIHDVAERTLAVVDGLKCGAFVGSFSVSQLASRENRSGSANRSIGRGPRRF